VDAGAERYRAVDHASGQHDIRAGIQRSGDRKGAEVGVDAGQAAEGRKRVAGKHFAGCPGSQVCCLGHQVITVDNGYLQVQSGRIDQLPHGRRAGGRIHAARIGDDLDPLPGHLRQIRLERRRDEIHRIAKRRIRGARPGQDRHGYLRQVVVDEVIEPTARQQLSGGARRLAPEAAGATDPDDSFLHGCGHGDRRWITLTHESKSV
jgi:hypothetical protein